MRVLFVAALALFAEAAFAAPGQLPGQAEIQRMQRRFAPTPIGADFSGLAPGERLALTKLIDAAQVVDELFLEQLWKANLQLWAKLKEDQSALGRARSGYFWLNKGPWSELDGYRPIVPGVPLRKPLGANFYPEDASKEELENFFAKLPGPERSRAEGFFSVIVRGEKGQLRVVPYSAAYSSSLTRAGQRLQEAAALTKIPSLARFLTARAKAFQTDDYLESDLAWMDLDGPIEVTFGPYETYNDELFGAKAAFEAYIGLRDEAETTRLAKFSLHLQELQDNLPLPPEQKREPVGALAPIRVVNEVFAAGDAAHGVQAAAYNLPNDERVVQQRGSKRVLLKNVQEAKFSKILRPIATRVMAAERLPEVRFDAFFLHILAHELCHGIGVHQIQRAGKPSTPREALSDLYSTIEEAKADALGLLSMQYLIDNAARLGLELSKEIELPLYSTFVASSFRTLRFGEHESHGKATAVQLNFLLDRGAVKVRPGGRFTIDAKRMRPAVRSLSEELLAIESTGDRARAERLLASMGSLRPDVKNALEKLRDLPVDIQPLFRSEQQPAGGR